MTTHIKDSYHTRRVEVVRRLEGIRAHYTELINHRKDVNRSIEVLEKELLRIEGELRLLEDLAREDHKLSQDQEAKK